MSLRRGILSTARINDKFIVGCAAADAVTVSAVASRDAARARRYANEHQIERAHGSYDALLADPELDAVYISLPNAQHSDWTLRAPQAGKHMLCETPLSRRRSDVAAAFRLAQQRGLILSEALMYRHHPQTARLAARVADGAVGRLRLIRAAFGFALSHDGDVRLSAALEGGVLMDVGCYCVNAVRLLAGEPSRVTGQQVLGGNVPEADSYRLEAEDMAAAAAGERDPRLGGADAVGQAATIEALYASAAAGGAEVPSDE